MELDAIGILAIAERLVLEHFSAGKRNSARSKREPFAVPVIDMARPIAEAPAFFLGRDRLISHFDAAFAMSINLRSEVLGKHLRAKADAEEWLLFQERHLDPVNFPGDVIVAVIGAHGAAENDGAAMVFHGFR